MSPAPATSAQHRRERETKYVTNGILCVGVSQMSGEIWRALSLQ